MKISKKIYIFTSVLVVLVVSIIIGRLMLNNFVQSKMNQQNPTEILPYKVTKDYFFEKVDTFGTAIANQSFSIRIKKADLINSVEFDKILFVKKGDLIANLKNERVIAPFEGRLGIREITPGILGGEDSFIVTLDDIKIIKIDIKIPESFLGLIKKDLKVEATTEAFKETFKGLLETVSARVDPTTRSILVQAKINNSELKIIPGMLINVGVILKEKNSLSIPEESVVQQGDKFKVYKIIDNKTVELVEVKVGSRNFGKVEILNGLNQDELIVREGISKVRNKGQIKVIN
ncbi:MAG: efflux RND transporter periplasmic adaptor subunit [Pelagibacterales bacterium]|nr:efflux RND transporter periplasmic adaptor subunit [Pelagibacterales bacterium]